MVISLLGLFYGASAEDVHSLLQARSATQLQSSNLVSQFSEKVQVSSGVVSVSKEGSMVCAMVTKGARAPVEGTFMHVDGDGATRAVRAPFVAPVNGKYCVHDHVFSMLQRAYGIHSAQDVEDPIVQKKDETDSNGNETEEAIGGKGGGEDADKSTNSKSGPTTTTTTTTTTDGPGAHCIDAPGGERRCCSRLHKGCDPGYGAVWDPTCEFMNPWNSKGEEVGCLWKKCYKCLPTGDPVLQIPICPSVENRSRTRVEIECDPLVQDVEWSRGVDYEGNPYYEEGLHYLGACVNETRSLKNAEFVHHSGEGVLCLGSDYQTRGCSYNDHVAMNRTMDDLEPNQTIDDYNWTGTLCRFLPEY